MNHDTHNQQVLDALSELSTPLIADACLRLEIPLRLAPSGIRAVSPEQRAAGRVIPVRHYGSVDIFLEAMSAAEPGDVLVIDNGGRLDEGCIGDLIALEAQACKLGGIVVWGAHRDAAELRQIGLPVFSYGTCPGGPRRLDPSDPDALVMARLGDCLVGKDDIVFGDLDGVLFVLGSRTENILAIARSIWETEREQARLVRSGQTLREQLQFKEYLSRRAADPSYTFRRHLRLLDRAIEE